METKLLELIKDIPASDAPFRVEFVSPHFEFLIPIGRDHTASITMDSDSYNALVNGDFHAAEEKLQ